MTPAKTFDDVLSLAPRDCVALIGALHSRKDEFSLDRMVRKLQATDPDFPDAATCRQRGVRDPVAFARTALLRGIQVAQEAVADRAGVGERVLRLRSVAADARKCLDLLISLPSDLRALEVRAETYRSVRRDYAKENVAWAKKAELAQQLDGHRETLAAPIEEIVRWLSALEDELAPTSPKHQKDVRDVWKDAFAFTMRTWWVSVYGKAPPTNVGRSRFVQLVESAFGVICNETVSWASAVRNAVEADKAFESEPWRQASYLRDDAWPPGTAFDSLSHDEKRRWEAEWVKERDMELDEAIAALQGAIALPEVSPSSREIYISALDAARRIRASAADPHRRLEGILRPDVALGRDRRELLLAIMHLEGLDQE